MGKFKLAVQIGRNATDILNLPCVLGVWKESWSDTNIRLRYYMFGDSKKASAAWGDSVYAYEGDWLCEDHDGVWHVLSNEEYEKQK